MDILSAFPYKEALMYIVAGAIAPGLVTLFIPLLKLPVLQKPIMAAMSAGAAIVMIPLQAIRGACYATGKIASAFLTKRLGAFGQKLEDDLQEFMETTVFQPLFKVLGSEVESFARWLTFGPFWKGLDEDDRSSVL
ncbi:MAG: hypothetical protein KKH61_19855, partial [Gammaproteobacteria bacterium]|nr:hypothetical protein [Gammaproteobacteria bacterium]